MLWALSEDLPKADVTPYASLAPGCPTIPRPTVLVWPSISELGPSMAQTTAAVERKCLAIQDERIRVWATQGPAQMRIKRRTHATGTHGGRAEGLLAKTEDEVVRGEVQTHNMS